MIGKLAVENTAVPEHHAEVQRPEVTTKGFIYKLIIDTEIMLEGSVFQ
jgi:hypothetical protein